MGAAKNGDLQRALMLGLKAKQLNYEPRGQLEYALSLIYNELLRSQPNLSGQRQ